MLRSSFLTSLYSHPFQTLGVESIEIKPVGRRHICKKNTFYYIHVSLNMNALPVDDADHAVFTVIGAVDTKFVQ